MEMQESEIRLVWREAIKLMLEVPGMNWETLAGCLTHMDLQKAQKFLEWLKLHEKELPTMKKTPIIQKSIEIRNSETNID